jgi:exodeoxyribonuclease-3
MVTKSLSQRNDVNKFHGSVETKQQIKLNVMYLNSNLRSNVGELQKIPGFIYSLIEENNRDIIVLSEFFKVPDYQVFTERLRDLGYTVFLDPREAKKNINQILIAVKTSLISDSKIYTLPDGDSFPNFLHIWLNIHGEELDVIGMRIKIGSEKTQTGINDDFKNRNLQLKKIQTYINNMSESNLILVGDFNNGGYRTGQRPIDFRGVAREFYNYPLISRTLQRHCLVDHTPDDSYSWMDDQGGKYKIDHIFSKNVKVINSTYSWDFTQKPKYKKIIGMPDHALMLATIVI